MLQRPITPIATYFLAIQVLFVCATPWAIASTSAGLGQDSGSASSTTQAAISGIAGNQAARTGDKETGIQKIFDANQTRDEINAQVAITSEFGKQASKAVGDYAQTQQDALRKAGQLDEAAKWAEGGSYRVLMHTALGGLGGGTAGALGAGTVASAAPLMNEMQDKLATSLEQAGMSRQAASAISKTVAQATALATGAALGGAQGGATALNVDANNRQLHATEKQRIKLLAKGNAKLEQELSDAACFKVHCSAAKNLDDASKAALLATEQAVQANAGGKYSQALALLEADSNSTGLFVYTPADKTLDALVAADPRSSGRASGLTREEMAAKAASLQACGTNARCIDQTNASYQRVASDRAEQALRIVMLTQRSRGCETDACQRETLAQMQALNNDLKAQGLGPQDSDRIALRAHMAATYAALGKPGASLDEFAAALIGTMGSEAGSKGVGAKGGAKTADEYVNILSPADRQHILFGDGPGSGGHMYPGQPGKSTYPQSWTEGQILHNVGDVVTSPTTQWYAQTGTGGMTTAAGKPARWIAWETRDGVSMRVVFEPATGRTVTAFPDTPPARINYKPIKK